MAEGDISLYTNGIGAIGRGDVDLGDSANFAIKLILLDSDYTFNADTHAVYGDVSASEYGSSDGYTAGGIELATVTWTFDSDNLRYIFGADDVTWSSLGPLEGNATPGYAAAYNDGAVASDDHLLFAVELGAKTPNGGDYTVAWSTNGIFYSS